MSEDELRMLAEKMNTQDWERYKPLVDKDISNIQARPMAAEQVRREISRNNISVVRQNAGNARVTEIKN